MNQHLQSILDFIQRNESLPAEEKKAAVKSLKDADSELEQKAAAVKAQSRELEIEAALERVRAVALSMNGPGDMLQVCQVISEQLEVLKVKEIRNVQTAIFYKEKGTYMNYEYYAKHNKTFITETFYTDHEIARTFAEKMLKGKGESMTAHINGDEVKDWIAYQKTTNVFIDDYLYTAASLDYYWYSLGPVALGISTYLALRGDETNLFKRFLKVFELSYRRYLDIEKAAAQAREAQIEAALEKIRSRSLAMHRSDELKEVMAVMFQKLTELDVLLGTVAIQVFDPVTKDCFFWIGNDKQEAAMVRLPYNEKMMAEGIYMKDCWDAWNREESFFNRVYSNEHKNKYFRYVFANNDTDVIPLPVREFLLQGNGHVNCLIIEKKSALFADSWNNQLYAEDKIDVLKRTAKVFDQAYVRFLDLQKAEAQAREARTEAVMEKVRSRAMAMQKPNELVEVAQLLRKEMNGLGVEELETSSIYIVNETTGATECWYAIKDFREEDKSLVSDHMAINLHDTWVGRQMLAFYRSDQKQVSIAMQGANRKEWINYCANHSKVLVNFYGDDIPDRTYHLYKFSNGYMGAASPGEISFESWDLLQRATSVFSLAYTRFSDLQQAEAQTREAQIQLALERARSQSMMMQHSSELDDVLRVFHEQVLQLGIRSTFSFLWLPDEEKDRHIFWAAWAEDNASIFRSKAINYPLDRNEPATAQCLIDWKGTEPVVSYHVPPAGIESYFASWSELIAGVDELKPVNFNSGLYYIEAFMKYGCFGVVASIDLTAEEKKILNRFAAEFEQTFTRFLDLQKAEAQTREAQIESALERVRSKTMAMHNSTDVGDTAVVMVDELKKLGIETVRCGIGIMHESGDMELWTIRTDENNKTGVVIGWIDMNIHPLLQGAFKSWRNKNEDYYYDLKDDDLLNYYNAINNYPGYPTRYDIASLPKQMHHNEFYFAEGILFAFALQQLTDDQKKIFKRFAGVFGQTYRRYLDLKKAEAQARESQIETALERVRSRTLAMQKSDELAETAAVVFRQLINLGIEPNRLYIGIVQDESGDMEMWATDEDGTRVGKKFTFNKKENISVQKLYDGWKSQKKSVVVDMQGDELEDYLNYLKMVMKIPFKGGLTQKRRVQSVAFFSKGFIGMASPDGQGQETIQLLERFAAVFNLTYTRFNDLQVAEAHAIQAEEDLVKLQTEKRRAEDALTELRETQKQLIQSEKMASLGELTAGIAHEIQNPLNFVNNFSEVSNELIEELKAERHKAEGERDKTLEDELLNDLAQNLEKINHHGKRADGIVKGMLQHSRSSSGQKEQTNINALADEYLRLAYHGLRAKDKSFNATLETDYDASIGNINIVPQDIGRVILNLITNAFYATNEQRKLLAAGYEPLVSVSTKKVADKIEISVQDNGGGIPQNIIDKIFQPFFTTKPTGQGTGLGLSLAYDIVKAHGGELKAETKENEARPGDPAGRGTTFIIQLPIN